MREWTSGLRADGSRSSIAISHFCRELDAMFGQLLRPAALRPEQRRHFSRHQVEREQQSTHAGRLRRARSQVRRPACANRQRLQLGGPARRSNRRAARGGQLRGGQDGAHWPRPRCDKRRRPTAGRQTRGHASHAQARLRLRGPCQLPRDSLFQTGDRRREMGWQVEPRLRLVIMQIQHPGCL